MFQMCSKQADKMPIVPRIILIKLEKYIQKFRELDDLGRFLMVAARPSSATRKKVPGSPEPEVSTSCCRRTQM
jgi:hypothetical protein